jgi:5-methylcytosine-specific restriction endonuclease McrA
MHQDTISATPARPPRKLQRHGAAAEADGQPKGKTLMAIKSPTASWRKDNGSSSERGYTYAWTKARKRYLSEHQLCVMCAAMTPPRITPANVVDHVIPHQGNQELFWDESNWAALCKQHHDSDKQMYERTGRQRAQFDAEGRVVW